MYFGGGFVSSISMLTELKLVGAGGGWGFCLNFFMALVWMSRAALSFTVWGFFSMFISELISSSMRPMSFHSPVGFVRIWGMAQFLPFTLGLF